MSTKCPADDSKKTSYVRKMAKHFETMYTGQTTYTNSLQANWWLRTSEVDTYLDEPSSDSEPIGSELCTARRANASNGKHVYGIEVAKDAYDQQVCDANRSAGGRNSRESSKSTFYDKIDFMLPHRSAANGANTSTYDHPAG